MHGHGQCGYASTLSMAYTCFPAPAILMPFCKWDHVLGLSCPHKATKLLFRVLPTDGLHRSQDILMLNSMNKFNSWDPVHHLVRQWIAMAVH